MTSRRLTRSRDDAMLGGVCAGISRTYDVDPTLVRLGFVLLTVVGGIGLVAYFVLWVLVPFDDDAVADAASQAAAPTAGAGAAPRATGSGVGGTSRAELDEAAKHAAEAARHAAEAARVAASAAVAAADQLARSTREALRRDPAPHGPATAAPSSSGPATAEAPGNVPTTSASGDGGAVPSGVTPSGLAAATAEPDAPVAAGDAAPADRPGPEGMGSPAIDEPGEEPPAR